MLLAILLQYLPKVLHTVRVYWKIRDVSGYVFGTAWAGFGVNLAAYLVSSHVSITTPIPTSLPPPIHSSLSSALFGLYIYSGRPIMQFVFV